MIFAPSIWTLEIDGPTTLAFEARKYRQAAEANKLSDDKLVHLIELDVVVSFRHCSKREPTAGPAIMESRLGARSGMTFLRIVIPLHVFV